MKDRNERLQVIKDLINRNRIVSQDHLLNLLQNQGISTTQATLSRDLKSLKVNKVFDGDKGYYYTLASEENYDDTREHYFRDIQRGFLSMEFSENLGVLNTLSGHANPVAAAIDRLNFDEILGTIAGDDTILLILKEGVPRQKLITIFDGIISGE